MTNYYFLAILLPKLEIGSVPDVRLEELETLLKDNLTTSDFNKVKRLRNFYDMLNIRAYWEHESLDYWGNLNINELEEELLTQEQGFFPPFVGDFLTEYASREERIQHFPKLLKSYFDDTIAHTTGFLKWYTKFERDLRLVLVGFRAKQLKRDLTAELKYENPEEDIIKHLLEQKDAKTFEPPVGFEALKPLLEKYYTSPLELQKHLSEYRFNKVEEKLEFDPFSIERILGYIVQYMMVDRWLHYDQQKGMEIIEKVEKS